MTKAKAKAKAKAKVKKVPARDLNTLTEALDMLAGLTLANSSAGGVVITLEPGQRADLVALLESLK
jgi:hypothetical protein